MMSLRILVTGSNGQLGNCFKSISEDSPHTFIFHSSKTLDITNKKHLIAFFESNVIDVVLNCAAFTDVDGAEGEFKSQAFQVNKYGVKNLAQVLFIRGIKLIHFSTDYVFDGKSSVPYKESDNVSPVNAYGLSKLYGEQEILASGVDGLIIRTSWLYSMFGHNFLKTMIRLSNKFKSLSVVNDQIGVPTNAMDLAKVVLVILSSYDRFDHSKKIYHYVNEGVASWYEFAQTIMEYTNKEVNVIPVSSLEFPTKATRPHFSMLDTVGFKKDFNIEIPYWRASLKECLLSNQVTLQKN